MEKLDMVLIIGAQVGEGKKVEQGLYPQEAATMVTPAKTDLLTTPQSGGQVPRIGHGSSTEQPQELPS